MKNNTLTPSCGGSYFSVSHCYESQSLCHFSVCWVWLFLRGGPISIEFGCFAGSPGCQVRTNIPTAHLFWPAGRKNKPNKCLSFLSSSYQSKYSLFFVLYFRQLHLATEAMWKDWLIVASPLLEPLQVSCREKSQRLGEARERTGHLV